MAHFDVLTEPWIPVIDLDGNRKELGILETLKQASELKEISDTIITNEYGVFRFLCAFLMDAYQPNDWRDLADLYDNKSFDIQIIQNYINECKKEGVSFDLFDKENPFLQTKYNNVYDKKLSSIAALNIALPSGNNHIHFNHDREEKQSMSFAEAARSLCALNLFCTAAAQGYPSTINGAPPIYFILDDKNLFGSLVYSMVAVGENKNTPYNKPPVLWRNKEEIIPKTQKAATSVLEGMIYPCRRVILQPEADGTVKNIYLCQGKNFTAYDSWRDPHVSYLKTEKGRISLKPNIEKEPWRNITTIITEEETAPIFMKKIIREKLMDIPAVKAYSVVTDQASYLDMQKNQMCMPLVIAKNETKRDRIQEIIQEVEYMSYELGKCLNNCYKKSGTHENVHSIQAGFLQQCKDYVLQDVLEKMASIPEQEASKYKENCLKELRQKCIRCFDQSTETFLFTGMELVGKQKIRTILLRKLYAKKKEKKDGA